MNPNQKKILVVDNEHAFARALELKLQALGFEVTVALEGDEALKCLDEAKFDLILLDLIMPGTDGFYVLEQMQSKDNTTPVVAVSNLEQAEDIQKAKDLGVEDYITKPETPFPVLIEYVQNYFA